MLANPKNRQVPAFGREISTLTAFIHLISVCYASFLRLLRGDAKALGTIVNDLRWHLCCCFGTTRTKWSIPLPPFGLPMVYALWQNGMQLLERVEKVPMAGAKGLNLANFIR
jgi:hypothetical protein